MLISNSAVTYKGWCGVEITRRGVRFGTAAVGGGLGYKLWVGAHMVVLVYDITVKSSDMQDTAQSYSYLSEIEHGLNQLVLGQACVRVQWVGDCTTLDKIQTNTLPHAHDTIIVYDNDDTYRKFKLSHPAVKGGADTTVIHLFRVYKRHVR